MECKEHLKPIKSEMQMQLKLYTWQCILKAASVWFCLVIFFFLANNSSFCVFLDQDAILCVKELETIMLMTSVK